MSTNPEQRRRNNALFEALCALDATATRKTTAEAARAHAGLSPEEFDQVLLAIGSGPGALVGYMFRNDDERVVWLTPFGERLRAE